MKNLILFLTASILLSSCNTLLLLTPGDVFYSVIVYIALSYFLAAIYTTDGTSSFNKYFFVNLFLTPLLGFVFYRMTISK